MVESPFAQRKSRKPSPAVREAGGDNEVERDHQGRPRIIVDCEPCCGTGKIRSAKREGRLNKCQPCKGEGQRKVSYTRVTTFIDVLESKDNLQAWSQRMTLLGVAMDPSFTKDVLSLDPTSKEGRDTLNRRAEAAAEYAGASDKADKGTFLHALSEMADQHEELPHDIDPQDWLDIQSYVTITHPLLKIVRMEQLVVNDHYKVAGTPDRVSSVLPGVQLTAPCRAHGLGCLSCSRHTFSPDELIITDLKTGRVDYGALKMAMQLAIYAHSDVYDKDRGTRIDAGPVNLEWGIIMHTPAGEGVTTLYWADLTMGWAAVELAYQVRNARREGKRALLPFASTERALGASEAA